MMVAGSVAGVAVGGREGVAGRGRGAEVAVRAAEALEVIGGAKRVVLVQDPAQLEKGCVLVEGTGKRPRGASEHRRQGGVRGEKGGLGGWIPQGCQGWSVVYGHRLVAHLTLVVSEIEEAVTHQRAAQSAAKLLAAVARLGDAQFIVDEVVGVQS